MVFVKGTLKILGEVNNPYLKFGGSPSQNPLKNPSKFKKSKNHYFSRTLNILKSMVYQQKVLKRNSLLKLNEKTSSLFFTDISFSHSTGAQGIYTKSQQI